MTDPNARIEAALARLGAEHEPPTGWEARVLAATVDRKPSRWWLVPIPLVVLAVIGILVIVPGAPGPAALTLTVTFARDDAVAYRTPSMMVGDAMRATATGGAGHRAVWIYRDGRLVTACPRDPQCMTSEDATAAALALPSVGRYVIIALTSSSAIAAPAGSEDADVAAAQRAGAKIVSDHVNVH